MALTMTLTGCFGSKAASSAGRGGEVVGVSGRSFAEPAPYGMVRVGRGYLRMGLESQDSLWGKQTPVKDISVDGFWMDETEVTTQSTSSSWCGCATASYAHDSPTRSMAATRHT